MPTAVEALKNSSVYAEEALVVDLQSLLHTVMVEKGITRAQLAEAMGVSKARISQLFSDDCTNFTVRILARALFALGESLEVGCPTLRQANARAQRMSAIEDMVWDEFSGANRWQIAANDEPMLVSQAASGRTNNMIAHAISRMSDHRRIAA
ncbi:hypothetical protein D3C71_1406180 [compost metagenome]